MAISTRSCSQKKKEYTTPRMVDFGSIESMTGDCFGICFDGMNGGLYGSPFSGA